MSKVDRDDMLLPKARDIWLDEGQSCGSHAVINKMFNRNPANLAGGLQGTVEQAYAPSPFRTDPSTLRAL